MLLREVARRAVAKQFAIVWLDGRDLPPFPAVIETALEPVHTSGPTLVVIDSYEMVSSLDNRLRELIIPELPESTIVIMASRQRPSIGLFDGRWDALFQAITLDGLSLDELRQLAAAHAGSGDMIAEGALEAFLRDAHGSPLAVVVGAQTGGIGPVAELADRLLGNDDLRMITVLANGGITMGVIQKVSTAGGADRGMLALAAALIARGAILLVARRPTAGADDQHRTTNIERPRNLLRVVRTGVRAWSPADALRTGPFRCLGRASQLGTLIVRSSAIDFRHR